MVDLVNYIRDSGARFPPPVPRWLSPEPRSPRCAPSIAITPAAIGVLSQGLLDSPYSLTEVRVMYEIAHRPGVMAAQTGGRAGARPRDT